MGSKVEGLLPTSPITMIHKAHQVKLSRSSGGEEHARVLLAVGSVPRYQSMCGTGARWWIRSARRNTISLRTCALNAFSINHLASVKSRKMVNATKRKREMGSLFQFYVKSMDRCTGRCVLPATKSRTLSLKRRHPTCILK